MASDPSSLKRPREAENGDVQEVAEPASRHSVVLIIDYGSQYTQLITRRVRELNIYSISLPAGIPLEKIRAAHPSAIILSGGPESVHVEGSPTVPDGFFEYTKEAGIPVLGICYGMQLAMHVLGGEVTRAEKHEYGRTTIKVDSNGQLYGYQATAAGSATEESVGGGEGTELVWMSHGDEVVKLPAGFKAVARSEQGTIVAVESSEAKVYGLQYHPEVTHTSGGMTTLRHFLFSIGKVRADWTMEDVLDEAVAAVRATVGDTAHAICALSGGVDSAVAATIVHKAIGNRLHCVFVDNGLLRYKEQERVMSTFESDLHLPVTCVDASSQFLSKLKGVTDPERKRKIIGAEFIAVFDEFAEKLEKELGHRPEFLVQGTLYPDVIESAPPPGGSKHSHTIKSHHNVGGLPPNMRLGLVEPLRWLFKDEVRRIGALCGVPPAFLERHPFPGPGLAVRVLGDVCADGALDTIRMVDEIFINEIKAAGLYHKIWQAFAVFLPVKSVGVQGDRRTHSHVVGLRAISSQDGMTADWFEFDTKFLREVSAKICNTVKGVNRVVYDITSKPPATVEWE